MQAAMRVRLKADGRIAQFLRMGPNVHWNAATHLARHRIRPGSPGTRPMPGAYERAPI